MGRWAAVSEILVNRPPFLTLWASVVARRLGYDADEALTLERAVAGQTTAARGKRLRTLEERSAPDPRELRTRREVLGAETTHFTARTTSCLRTPQGLRALAETTPIDPNSVRRYIESKFMDAPPLAELRLAALAPSAPSEELEACAMDLAMRMCPAVAGGKSGVGPARSP